MRQTSKRCPPEKRIPGGRRHAGVELDLGLAVSVYCAESGIMLVPDGVEQVPVAKAGANVTEH